ncbi:MarR family winged helix-turn-helix transcriptional regulator [Streptomyces sp. ODS05-4]|uniref:MarR family winged helix-turn-helix transcriptional regulator n=1 Tax=Streptomyces sp. ODS05-4 TaxID=2944939 RepID=UPI0021090C27|nr:MarR family transcriptional regulator [Streptomyces sp. ODS05-4]
MDSPASASEPAAAPPLPAPDPDGVLAEQLLRLTRRIHRSQKRQLDSADVAITPAQSRLLRTVAHYEQPPRMADLAARLEVVPRAVTSLVDGLEASGRVRRSADPANRRVVRIELTETGRDTLRTLRTARRAAAEDVLAPLSREQREVLGGLLSALVDGVVESAADGTGDGAARGAADGGADLGTLVERGC